MQEWPGYVAPCCPRQTLPNILIGHAPSKIRFIGSYHPIRAPDQLLHCSSSLSPHPCVFGDVLYNSLHQLISWFSDLLVFVLPSSSSSSSSLCHHLHWYSSISQQSYFGSRKVINLELMFTGNLCVHCAFLSADSMARSFNAFVELVNCCVMFFYQSICYRPVTLKSNCVR